MDCDGNAATVPVDQVLLTRRIPGLAASYVSYQPVDGATSRRRNPFLPVLLVPFCRCRFQESLSDGDQR